MARYEYSGTTILGESVSGLLRASNPRKLEGKLFDSGVILKTYRPIISKIDQIMLRLFHRTEITRVTRQIGILLESKISVIETLQLAVEQIKSKTLISIMHLIIPEIESGKPMSQSFAGYMIVFDDLYISMIKAGELSGNLDSAFGKIAEYRERYDEFLKKLRSSLAYPALVLFVAVLVILAIVFYIIPVFSSLYESFNADLPPLTKSIVFLSKSIREHAARISLVLLLVLLSGALLLMNKQMRNSSHRLVLRVPIIGTLIIKVVTARFCRTMGSLLLSGVDIILSLQLASKTGRNLHIMTLLDNLQYELIKGQSFAESIKRIQIFPNVMLKLCAAGEKTGQLGEMLLKSAEYYEAESNREISTLTSLIEPLIIMFLGIVIGLILVALYLPLFNIVGNI